MALYFVLAGLVVSAVRAGSKDHCQLEAGVGPGDKEASCLFQSQALHSQKISSGRILKFEANDGRTSNSRSAPAESDKKAVKVGDHVSGRQLQPDQSKDTR